MKNKMKYIVTLSLSLALCIGMCYALYMDLNYFITKKDSNATMIRINEAKNRKSFHIELQYYNKFLNKPVGCILSLNSHKTQTLRSKYEQGNQVRVFYVKNHPYRIYMENINAPRWIITLLEISIILLMLFSIKSSVRSLATN